MEVGTGRGTAATLAFSVGALRCVLGQGFERVDHGVVVGDGRSAGARDSVD